MGLFSDKKIINVSSTLYNMAGPEEDRPNFLKGTLFSSVMANSPSLADDITTSYFEGPGIKQRQFFNYAQRNNLAGLPTITATNNSPVDSTVVSPHIPVPATPAGLTVNVLNSQLTDGDPEDFVERWILENHPDRVNEEWLGEFNELNSQFSVQFPNGDFFSFTDSQYSTTSRYIVAKYILILSEDIQPWVNGTPVSVTAKTNLTGWNTVQESGNFTSVVLNKTSTITKVYSDNTPDEVTTQSVNENAQLNTSIDIYQRIVSVGKDGLGTEGQGQRYTYTGTDYVTNDYSNTVTTTETISGGVTVTTTTVTTGEQVNTRWNERYDTQKIIEGGVFQDQKMYIYTIGSGITDMDALATSGDTSNFQEFFPFLPLRLNNVSVRENPYLTNTLFDETKKAYRKVTNLKNINKVLDDIEENDSIDDIDYAYIIYGCSLNVQEQACRKYIFNFFEEMIQFQNSSASTISQFESDIQTYSNKLSDLQNWQDDTSAFSWELRSTRPDIPALSVPSMSSLNLRTDSPLMPSFDIRIQWAHIQRDQLNGVYSFTDPLGNTRPAKVGEVMFTSGSKISWQEREGYNNKNDELRYRLISKEMDSIIMFYQISDTEYRRLRIYGLTHFNYIYGGKSVKITGSEALADTEESGFVIPLHAPTMRAMSIVDYTQMATANTHILFNSYTITKQKWWQTGIFKILLIIIVIVVAVIIAPGAFAGGAGILGGNLAVGTALGLTGTAALVAGVVANYLAAMIISQLLTTVGTALFGKKFGALFAAIASFALGVAMNGFTFDAAGLLRIGNVLANGYAGWVQGDIAEMQDEFNADTKEYERKMDYINELIQGLGGNNLNFNPIFLTDSVRGNDSIRSGGYTPESADEFIRRTTMTGSDIIEITHSMVYDFVDVQQTLPRN